MTRYSSHVSALATPQSERAKPEQVRNNAGGYVFAVDKWTRLDRFLVLGSEGGTYYVDEKPLTIENARVVEECLIEDGPRAVARIVTISDAGRAPKNDPAIFALAMACATKDAVTRRLALSAIPRVCRIGTHLFHFAQDVEQFRGWGRSLRRAVASWYNDKPVGKLAFQLIKYQARDGWSHRDLLRLAHPHSSKTGERAALYRWATAGAAGLGQVREVKGRKYLYPATPALPEIVQAFEKIHSEGVDWRLAAKLIQEHKLPHECVPNELKNRPEIWEALLPHMGTTALIRNLGKMTAVGLLKPLSDGIQEVVSHLTSSEKIFAGRVHPMSILIALKTYASGHGVKGNLSWSPVREIVDALDNAFYLTFEAIEPTGKRFLLALDVSGSMDSPISGTVLTCREASAAIAMAVARSEKNWHVVAFTRAAHGWGGMHGGGPPGITPVPLSPRQRLNDVVKIVHGMNAGGTDCAQPMLYATREKLDVDAFVTLTDNETWAGDVHPFQALREYRNKSGIAAKNIVVGMTSSGFTIADPSDAGSLDVVGLDAATPSVICDFAAGRLAEERSSKELE